MQAGSARAQAALLEALDGLLDGGADPSALGDDLFGVVGVLDREPALRRLLTEPTVAVEARTGMARQLFAAKISEPAVALLEAAVSERWSRTRDLAAALERCAVIAEASRADRAGELDAVEDELFRFARVLAANPALRDALSDRAVPLDARRELLVGLVEGKVVDVTKRLLEQLLVGRHQSLAAGLEYYQEIAAARRQRLLATVWVASPLSDAHRARLAELLTAQHDHEVHLNVLVDKDVLGGIRVAIGDEVIDGSIETRLEQATRRVVR